MSRPQNEESRAAILAEQTFYWINTTHQEAIDKADLFQRLVSIARPFSESVRELAYAILDSQLEHSSLWSTYSKTVENAFRGAGNPLPHPTPPRPGLVRQILNPNTPNERISWFDPTDKREHKMYASGYYKYQKKGKKRSRSMSAIGEMNDDLTGLDYMESTELLDTLLDPTTNLKNDEKLEIIRNVKDQWGQQVIELSLIRIQNPKNDYFGKEHWVAIPSHLLNSTEKLLKRAL